MQRQIEEQRAGPPQVAVPLPAPAPAAGASWAHSRLCPPSFPVPHLALAGAVGHSPTCCALAQLRLPLPLCKPLMSTSAAEPT